MVTSVYEELESLEGKDEGESDLREKKRAEQDQDGLQSLECTTVTKGSPTSYMVPPRAYDYGSSANGYHRLRWK